MGFQSMNLDPVQSALAVDQAKEEKRQFNLKYGLYQGLLGQQQQVQGGMNSLLDQYNNAYNAAKAANEQKYQQQLGLVNQVSGQQKADTIAGFNKQRADSMQQLARLGMANTTIAPTVQAGIQREQSGALNRLADQMLGTKLGVMQGFNYQGMDPQVTSTAISALAPKLPTFSL
jgi:hypothetical protein